MSHIPACPAHRIPRVPGFRSSLLYPREMSVSSFPVKPGNGPVSWLPRKAPGCHPDSLPECLRRGISGSGFGHSGRFLPLRIGQFRPFPTLSQGNGRFEPILNPVFWPFPHRNPIEMVISRLRLAVSCHYRPWIWPFRPFSALEIRHISANPYSIPGKWPF